MSKNANHIINKEIFEFSYAEAEQAFTLQREMNDSMLAQVHYEIGHALSESFDPGEYVGINKLEIDLGEIPFNQLSEVIPLKIYGHFKEKLQSVLVERKHSVIVNAEKLTTQDDLSTIEFFLHTGKLPWWASHFKKQFSFTERLTTLLQTNHSRLEELLSANLYNPEFVKRLVYQSAEEIHKEIFALVPHLSPLIAAIEKILDSSINHFILAQNKDASGEIDAVTKTSMDRFNGDLTKHQEMLTGKHTSHQNPLFQNREFFQKIIELLLKQRSTTTIVELRSQIKEKVLLLFEDLVEIDKLEIAIEELVTPALHTSFERFKEEVPENTSKQLFPSDGISTLLTEEKDLIENAGLVLASTFLPALFKEFRWIENGQFNSKEAQFRAIFLLHYMATGETEAPEYSLQLNKLLIGLDPMEPLPLFVNLTGAEKAEADQLLTDMITHWTVLKTNSIEGFRASFILRDGLLSCRDGHWVLQVEKKGYDILMDHIPWSWRTVRFTWMETYIDTEW